MTAARPKQEAVQGAFARLLVEAIRNERGQLGGATQAYLSPWEILPSVNAKLPPSQQANWTVAPPVPALPPLIPNRRFDSSLPAGLDLASQRQRDFAEHWVPRARGTEMRSAAWYFTGRTAALRTLVSWLNAPEPDGKARVVTGGPGTGSRHCWRAW